MTSSRRTGSGSGSRGGHLPARRKADLVAFVLESGQVSVTELAQHFSVSADTIRRDLDELDASGTLLRTHGGAVSPTLVPRTDTGLDVRSRLHSGAKETIGKLAAELVGGDGTLMINGGTTALALATHLPAGAGLRIITNNLHLPAALSAGVADEIFMVGGAVRVSAQATTGPISSSLGIDRADEFDVRCDLAFIGVGAVSAQQGFSTGNVSEAGLMREMMRRSDRVVVLADSTKLGRSVFARIGALEMADVLVTDAQPDPELGRALADAEVEVIHPR